MAVRGSRPYGARVKSAILGGVIGAALVGGGALLWVNAQPQVVDIFRSVDGPCTIGMAGTALQITYEGPGASTACDDAVNGAASDASWYRVTEPAGVLVCRIPASENAALMLTVRDQGALMVYGHEVCSSYTGT